MFNSFNTEAKTKRNVERSEFSERLFRQISFLEKNTKRRKFLINNRKQKSTSAHLASHPPTHVRLHKIAFVHYWHLYSVGGVCKDSLIHPHILNTPPVVLFHQQPEVSRTNTKRLTRCLLTIELRSFLSSFLAGGATGARPFSSRFWVNFSRMSSSSLKVLRFFRLHFVFH